MTRACQLFVCAAVVMALGAPGAAVAARKAPEVRQLVVFRAGDAVQRKVLAAPIVVRAEGRRCAVARSTALAALVRSKPGRIGLTDFGRCGRSARDGGGLFVERIRGDRNAGQDGWTYKVGRRAATAGAADPAGAFGNGRLRGGQRVTWFFCRLRGGSCQRTLELKTRATAGQVAVTVRGYDDEGRGVAVAGATVSSGASRVVTDAAGRASMPLPAGRHTLVARKQGLIRSFAERVVVP